MIQGSRSPSNQDNSCHSEIRKDVFCMKKTIDVSAYQGIIDWPKVAAAGVEYAIIRAGVGRTAKQIDKCFYMNVTGAKEAGIKVGPYWFGYAISPEDAKIEANACYEIIKGIDFELPIIYDYEYASFDYAKKQGVTLSKEAASDIVISFLEEMKAKGYRVANYTNPDCIKNKFDNRISKYDTWIAHYQNNADITKKYTYNGFNVIGWQYSSTGAVDGINGNVDMDVFYIDAIESDSTPTQEPTSPENASTVKVGDKVKVKSGAKFYNGVQPASFVYKTIYTVLNISGDRVVIGIGTAVTGAVKISELEIVTSPSKATETNYKNYTIKLGDSFWSIATSQMGSGTKMYELASYNGLSINSVIHPGQTLKIPM